MPTIEKKCGGTYSIQNSHVNINRVIMFTKVLKNGQTSLYEEKNFEIISFNICIYFHTYFFDGLYQLITSNQFQCY